MSGDWIKLHRQIIDSEVFTDHKLLAVWVWCLCRANFKEKKFRGQTVLPGQFVTGRKSGAEALGLSESSFYRALNRLKKMGNIELKSNNKMTTVTICHWRTYQDAYDTKRTTNEQQMNNKRTTNEQQMNTREERKKERKEEGKNNKSVISGANDGHITAKEFFDRWNNFVSKHPKLKAVRKLTEDRKRKLAVRLRSEDWFKSFREALNFIPLAGEGWQPTFDWLIRNDVNVERICEGEFEWRANDKARERLDQRKREQLAELRRSEISEKKAEDERLSRDVRESISGMIPKFKPREI